LEVGELNYYIDVDNLDNFRNELKDNFENILGQRVFLNASNWRYVLLQYEDGLFEILVEALNMHDFSEEDSLMAANIVLEGILGEEVMIVAVTGVEVLDSLEPEYNKKAIDAYKLQEYMTRFFKNN
jgi:hypothetical protein